MICEHCKTDTNSLVVKDLETHAEMWCWNCINANRVTYGTPANVIDDSIPGGVDIRHGICNDDGTPKRYYSRSDIKKAAYEAGYFQGDDTPKSNPRIAEQRAREFEARIKDKYSWN